MISALDELKKLDTEEFHAPVKKKKQSPLVILRREFFNLLKNYPHEQKQLPYCAAKLIDYYLHWHKWKLANQRTAWVYQPIKNIYDDLMGEHSRHLIRDAIDLLMHLGYLERRGNPGNGQDRTFQYRLCVKRVISAVENYKSTNEAANTVGRTKDIADIYDIKNLADLNEVDNFDEADDDFDEADDDFDEADDFSGASESSDFSLPEKYTGHSFVRSEHGEFKTDSGKFNVEQYQQLQSIEIRSKSIDGEKDFKKPEEVSQSECQFLNYTVEIPSYTNALVTSMPNAGEEQVSAAELPNPEITDPDEVKQQELTNGVQRLSTTKENNRSVTPRRQSEPRYIQIEDVDEETHEILWKHQAELTRLNVDLDANRIQNAIADNPQYLENAIFALFEASAQRKLTKEAATGYLYNALRNGWKPKYAKVPIIQKPHYFTAPPQFFEKPQPPTLAELVERKRQAWKVAILRPFIEAWAKITPGVVITASGPALEPGYQS